MNFTVHVLAAQTPSVQFTADAPGDPDQGDTATFTVTATDYTGTTAPLAATDYTVTSSIASDVITTADGAFSVSFPHASPHTLTVTQTSTGATAQLVVEVTPAPVATAALPQTGSDAAPTFGVGVLLLLLGGLALAAHLGRRRGMR
ncbi:LPXTG cell wall anchor domain-containing protein [Schumannella luteola]|nr:LPXTG cell wall anchor domain-containing protein [Schumannella luteola]